MTVRVLVVDDSETMRAVLRATLEAAGMRVVGEAHDGPSAIEGVAALRPDVVTMDVWMPGMDGLTCIERIMASTPTRILVVSSAATDDHAALSMRAIGAGALEVLAKPGRGEPRERFARSLVESIRLMAVVPVVTRRPPLKPLSLSERRRIDVIGIVASTGGPRALMDLLTAVRTPSALPPIAVAQHLAPGFVGGLRRWLSETGFIVVVGAAQLAPGHVYLADDAHDILVEGGSVVAARAAGLHVPSGDRLLRAVARFGTRGAGVVLSGMGDDGAHGLAELRRAGGLTLAQSPESCVVGGMPQAAMALGAVEHVADAAGIAALLQKTIVVRGDM